MAIITDTDPFALAARWMADAVAREPSDADAAALATTDAKGHANLRMVLVKALTEEGFCFYSYRGSVKARELGACPHAALAFHWKSLRRQLRVRGAVLPTSREEAAAYFATRARASRLGAWASRQSRPLASRAVLNARLAVAEARFKGKDVPAPPAWCGFRLVPVEMEFWTARRDRLHERQLFTRASPKAKWRQTLLFP